MLARADNDGMTTSQTTRPVTISAHAMDRCNGERAIPPAAVVAIVRDKMVGITCDNVAVLVYIFPAARGDYFHPTQSNGECLWAIVRENVITTVFYRRKSQPSGKADLHVSLVIR